MATRSVVAIAAGAALLLGGCAYSPPGLLYTRTVRPYMTDFDHTPVGSRRCVVDEHRIKEPFSGYGISVEWSESVIRAAARDCGITVLTHSDVEIFSVVFGIYSRHRLIVYGD